MSRDLDQKIAVVIKRVAWGLLFTLLATIGGCSVVVYTVILKVSA